MTTLPETGLEAREDRVREIAHALWEEEGRPEGMAETHWLRACDIAAAEEGSPAWLKYAKFPKDTVPRLDEEIAKQLAAIKAA